MVSFGASTGEGHEVWFINRSLVILRHRAPFASWAKGVDDDSEDLYGEGWTNAYLVPDFEFDEEVGEWLGENYKLLFEMELESWMMDDSTWPPHRTWEMFREWFEVEVIDTAWDVVNEPLSSVPPN